ncbi:MAG: phytoene desaturase family protein [Vicingaceae bacterium]
MIKISIIGSGFSSLAAACYLAKEGYDIDVYEKNASLGGRARVYEHEGFRFDMGPSWYWMPDVFERFFEDFDKAPADYYKLDRLDPAYKVYFDDGSAIEIPSSLNKLYDIFDQEEKGSSTKLREFLEDARQNYNVAIKELVYKPGISPMELVTPKTISKINQFFSSVQHEVHKRFKSEKLRKILEFPVLFLGAKPSDTPAFYNFMNHADLALGTWYPQGGMFKVVEAMVDLGKELGVKFHTMASVDNIPVVNGKTAGLIVNGELVPSDIVLSGADYYHTESLLDGKWRMYSPKYWSGKTFAPSALLFYVGFNKKLENLRHHTLFFDKDFDAHAKEIYDIPSWPKDPLFYTSFPSVTDATVAPSGKECAFFLIPLAPDLTDSEELRTKYFNMIMDRFEQLTGQKVRDEILFQKSYCVSDFKKDYNSYKGNAYGMANTLLQTAFLRPKIRSKKVHNLFFTGQLTVPGPGVPPALISGKIAAEQIVKHYAKSNAHVAVI